MVPCCLLDGICLNSIDKPTCTVDIYQEVTHIHNEFPFKSWKLLAPDFHLLTPDIVVIVCQELHQQIIITEIKKIQSY